MPNKFKKERPQWMCFEPMTIIYHPDDNNIMSNDIACHFRLRLNNYNKKKLTSGRTAILCRIRPTRVFNSEAAVLIT